MMNIWQANLYPKLQNELNTPAKNIVIITHKNPDGDAIGSTLGLFNFLKEQGHKVYPIVPNDYPYFLQWMPGNEQVLNFETDTKKVKTLFDKLDFIFCLDFNNLQRINEELANWVNASEAYKVLIDHHPQPDNFTDVLLSDVKASSTAEMVYMFIKTFAPNYQISVNTGTCIYSGILTDTGSFKFPSTSATTHQIAAELIKIGVKGYEISSAIYNNNTENRLRLLGFALSQKLVVLPQYATAFISLSDEELKKYNYQKGDIEGLVNYCLTIKGIVFAAIFVDMKEMIKISFRSEGNFDVNNFCRQHFDGGGHVHAAGGRSFTSLDETIQKFISILPQYQSWLCK